MSDFGRVRDASRSGAAHWTNRHNKPDYPALSSNVELAIHPLADLFPRMTDDEFEHLKADIDANGQRDPITLYQGKTILDGRNRYRACRELGIVPKFEPYTGEDAQLLDFVLSRNLHRRHLTSSQKAVLALDVERILAEEAKKRQLATLKQNVVVEATVPQVFAERTEPEQPAPIRREEIPAPKGEARDQAAQMLGTNRQYVSDAKRIAAQAPELVEDVRAGDISLPEAKALAKETPEIRREVIDRVKSGEFPSAHRALDEVRKPHVAHNSGENEWYTPAEYIEAARRVLGGIDLDPASSDIANHTVQASRYFDAATNGLLQEWHGRVWMNPPYSKDLIEGFCRQLVTEYSAGRTTQAIVLVNNATETRWFQLLLQHAAAVCFPASRIRFVDPQGNPSGAPLQGQAVLFFGSRASTAGADVATFRAEFAQFGAVLTC